MAPRRPPACAAILLVAAACVAVLAIVLGLVVRALDLFGGT